LKLVLKERNALRKTATSCKIGEIAYKKGYAEIKATSIVISCTLEWYEEVRFCAKYP
jgi:uncharacterized protein YdaT